MLGLASIKNGARQKREGQTHHTEGKPKKREDTGETPQNKYPVFCQMLPEHSVRESWRYADATVGQNQGSTNPLTVSRAEDS